MPGSSCWRSRSGQLRRQHKSTSTLPALSDDIGRYLRVKLAAEILAAEVATYRQRNQGPILRAANEMFPKLTLGAYRELRVGYDARDEESLFCVRKDGSEVGVEGLSDGTRDHLYLALRLSTLRHFSAANQPLPLVLDDVFVHFDDPRAAAALRLLGELTGEFADFILHSSCTFGRSRPSGHSG